MQRDRIFENYQDLEAFYHQRPGYWVEPIGDWGEGRVELVEIPTDERDRTTTSSPTGSRSRPYEPGQEVAFGYRMRAVVGDGRHASGRQGREHLPGAGARERLERAGRSDRRAAS